MAKFIAAGTLFQHLPPGAYDVHVTPTWGLYHHPVIPLTWLVWTVPRGLQLVAYPGRRGMGVDLGRLEGYAKQRMATSCGQCPD